MSSLSIYPTPLGSKPTLERPIPHASMAQLTNSSDFVSNEDQDAFFFRDLERSQILLNEAQVQAVRHFKGPLLTLAGAGSGKTTVLVCRVAYLLRVHRVHPSHLLLITFSKKAAEEMRERLTSIPGLDGSMTQAMQVRTFHAFCLRLLRMNGFQQEILSDGRYQQIVFKRIMLSMGLQDTYQPEVLIALLSSYKMQLIEISDLPEQTEEDQEMKKIFLQYEQWKMEQHKMDFDDILLMAYQLLKQNADILRSLERKFAYISVDEFQDTNTVQYEIIQMIAQNHQNLMVVGDDDQTIYSFNGARNEFILQFHQKYPTAKTVTLDINYRSTSSIVGLGNAIIRHNIQRKSKTLLATKQSDLKPLYVRPSSSDDEADWLVNDLRIKVAEGGKSYGDFAILYRTANNSRAIIEQLILHNLPFVDYGSNDSFYDQWMVKPIIDHLRIAHERRNFEAIEGVLPSLYIGRDQGMRIIQDQEAIQPKKWPLIHLLGLPQLKEFQKEKLKSRIKLIKSLADMKPLTAVQAIRKDFYDTFLETNKRSKLTHHREMLKETLDELESSAKRFDSVEQFLYFIHEVAEKRTEMSALKKDQAANRISLMTIHKSKGLEFSVVYLLCAIEGNMPHSSALDAGHLDDVKMAGVAGRDKGPAALEEERRLAYVAVTRAKAELLISSPAYYRGKKAEPSRFLLSAFPGADAGIVTSRKPAAAGISGTRRFDAAAGAGAATEEVAAWLCSQAGCKAWSRISSPQEARLTAKACPLCGAAMVKGKRTVSLARSR
ncbi:UvrD-helicase domain-containing protein [Paenibacillus sp. HWE-109]|uniref:UvrD-helicase domain-containing protein n=1 Tax=Paenibacillus sp. HWE-109 TaxID=1306526 RepID=UPI001EDEEA4C|nr:UvrD-helicase domain-containing protein [Paenibacillus sp. HWE-109]UKS26327.1 UvrD-helicase domain-containing protein [Paenibacillus sp. HWE-109]